MFHIYIHSLTHHEDIPKSEKKLEKASMLGHLFLCCFASLLLECSCLPLFVGSPARFWKDSSCSHLSHSHLGTVINVDSEHFKVDCPFNCLIMQLNHHNSWEGIREECMSVVISIKFIATFGLTCLCRKLKEIKL